MVLNLAVSHSVAYTIQVYRNQNIARLIERCINHC